MYIKPSIYLKFSVSLIFFLVVSSVCANVFSKEHLSAARPIAIEETLNVMKTHPLTGMSDNVVFCSVDGSQLHEIYLCGTNDERLLITNITDLKQIVWTKLDEGSCSNPSSGCANTSSSCIWAEQSSDTQFNVTEGGQYRIVVQYTNNNIERFYFNVFENGLDPNALVQNIDCGSPGSITVTNVPDGYEYSITGGASWQDSNSFSIDSASDYDIDIRKKDDAGGCVLTMSDILVQNNSIDAIAKIDQITCNDASGTITIDITNASSDYIFKLTQGGNLLNSSGPISSSSYTFTDLEKGQYDVEVRLSSISDCIWKGTFDIDPPTAVAPEAVVTKNIDCTDGVITLTETRGSSPFQYSVDNGLTYFAFASGNQTTIPIDTAGSYTLKVRDANNCIKDSNTVSIIAENKITYTIEPKGVSCSGVSDGSITVNVMDAQGYSIMYSIDGTNFQTSKVFSNLSARVYDVVIRKQKAGGTCDLDPESTTVGNSSAFSVTPSVTQEISCTSGSATIAATVGSGANEPLEYSLDGSTFQTSNEFTGLGAGDYTITVRDANGCTATADQTITNNSDLSNLTFLATNIDCATGATDIQITVEGGTAPYSFRMTAPSVATNGPNDNFTGLMPNTYSFEVTADNGCIITRNYTVARPIQFNANVNVKTNVSCAGTGASDGSIDIDIENYDTSFNVVVEDGAGNDTGLGVLNSTTSPFTITGLAADNYTIRFGDASGPCEQIEMITIAEPTTALTIDSFTVSPINCGSPGGVSIEALGGWGNYSYQVSQPDATLTPKQSNKNVNGLLQTGTHTIILSDINGCVVDNVTFDLKDQGGPVAAVDKDYAGGSPTNYCYSTATKGVLKIDIDSGEGPFFYTVNNSAPTAVPAGDSFTLSNLTPFDYVVKIIGNNGCEAVVADTKIAGQLFASAEITKPFGCGTPPDALIDVVPQEGYPPFTFTMVGDATATPIEMPYSTTTEGFYSFNVVDNEGCTTTTNSIEVKKSLEIIVDPNISNTACGKPGTGSVELVTSGGTPPFTYSFDGSPFTTKTLYSGLNAQPYEYIVRDNLGCESGVRQVTIGAEAAIEAEITTKNITCDPAGGNQWGNTNIKNVQNATGLLNIKLIRVANKDDYEAGIETRTWTYRKYEDVDMSLPRYADGFNIVMYWPRNFIIQIEDEKGCFYESDVYTITSPPIPSGISTPDDLQTCENGATYLFSINNKDSDGDGTPDLVGPFETRLYPYQLVDDDGDGVEDDVNSGWREFNNSENPAWDGMAGTGTIPNERHYTFTSSTKYGKLLFGVAYNIAIRDRATGCVRWRALKPIVQPPLGVIKVDAVPQSESCYGAGDGQVELTITDYASGPVNYRIYNAGRPQDSNFYYPPSGSGTVSGTGAPITFTVPNDFRAAWYVVEVEDSSGCQAGQRFLIHKPKSKLRIDLDQVVSANCNVGAQISVIAKGGWDDQAYFNVRNKLDQTSWHEYEYAYVLSGTTPTTADWGPKSLKEVPYDSSNPSYDVYVRDGSGCTILVTVPVTLEPQPSITKIDVLDRCFDSDGNEIYEVNATVTLGKGANVYIWDGTVTDSNITQVGPGNHTLIVRDENGCETPLENIHIYPQLVPQIEISKNLDCVSSSSDNGEITAAAYGGSGTYEFTLEPIPSSFVPGQETNTTGIFDGLAAGIDYRVLVTDIDPQISAAERCDPQYTEYIRLEAPADPDFMAETLQNVSCTSASGTSDDGVIRVVQTAGVDNLDVTYEFNIDGGTFQSSNLFENLTPGSHIINVRSAKNCIQILNTTISAPDQLVLSASETSSFSCDTDNNPGMATIEATVDNAGSSSGTAPYQFKFDNGSFSSTTTYRLPYRTTPQDIVVDVIDANGCTDQVIVNIAAVNKVTAEVTMVTPMDCATDGEYEITIPPTTSNFSITELPNASATVIVSGTTINITRGNPGNYYFLVTDNDSGCTDNVVIEIPTFDTLEIIAEHDKDITCYTGSDGVFKFTVSGYSGAFEYEVFNINDPSVPLGPSVTGNTSSGEVSVTGLPAGTFFVDVRSIETPGCKEISNTVTIQSPTSELTFLVEETNQLTCTPGNDAQITITPEGGWGTYSLNLVLDASGASMPANTADYNIFDNLGAGDYTLTVTDVRGCLYSQAVVISPIDFIELDPSGPTVVQPSCTSFNDASITVSASRVNGPIAYEYILNNLVSGVSTLPQVSNTFADLAQGDYSVTVIDGYGCDVTTGDILVRDPAAVTINAAITQEPTCPPNNIGQVTVTGSGGSGSYNFRILAPASAATAWTATPSLVHVYSSLASDTYEFEARDATFLCPSSITAIRTINIVEPLEISVDESNTVLNCNGDSDAILVALATKGLGNYEYQLEDDAGSVLIVRQPSGTFEMLAAGTYRIRAFSGTDCEVLSELITIDSPALLDPVVGPVQDEQCFENRDGSFEIIINSGEAPFKFILSTEPSKAVDSPIFENLSRGTYSVTVQDVNGCERILSDIFVDGPDAELIAVVTDAVNEVCAADDDGSFVIEVSGGTAPYSYSLGNRNGTYSQISGSTQSFTNLDAGVYEVYIRDANDCDAALILQEIKVGSDLSAVAVVASECRDRNPFYTATITLLNDEQTTDGLLYALDGNPSQLENIFEAISAGSHTVEINDSATGCINTISFTVTAQEPLVLQEGQGKINQILVQATGGDGNYTYYFEGVPQSTGAYYIARDGNYTIRVVDGNGCEDAIQVPMEYIDIVIPNFFSPNGDGMNDVWRIENNEAFPNMYIKVYDRYGRTLKEFIGSGVWDGTYNNRNLPTGDYWYVIKLNGVKDKREFVGNFSIYR